MENNAVFYDQRHGCWCHNIEGTTKRGFKTKLDAAKDFVTHYIEKHPKYKELVQGKTWPQIFSMFKISTEEPYVPR